MIMIIENFKDDKEALRAMTGELVRYMDRKDDGLPVMCTAFMEKWNLVRKRCVIRVS